MRLGLDYRPAAVAPRSGIGRQVLAMEAALRGLPQDAVQLYAAAPNGYPLRQQAHCPAWQEPLAGMHRLPARWRFEARFLPRAVAEDRLDVYIATANSGLPLGRIPPALRQVLLLHDLFQLTLPNRHRTPLHALAYRGIDRLAIGHAVAAATVIWTPSQFTADEAADLFPRHAGKLRVLPNAVSPLRRADAAPPAGLPARYWLVVGSREPRKNIPCFLDAWREARGRAADVPAIVLVGHAGDLPPAYRQMTHLHVLDALDDARLAALYAQAERLWHPAYAEGFGLPVVEALAAGTPVAVARGSALDEVTPPDAARFDPHDGPALSALMLRLAARPAAPDREACRAFAARFAPEAYAARLHELLDELRR